MSKEYVAHVSPWIAKNILSLRKGERIRICRHELREHVQPPPGFTAADWILEQIIGSAYEFMARYDDKSGDVIFDRLAEPLAAEDGSLTYVSPDRRHFYDRDIRGIYHLKVKNG